MLSKARQLSSIYSRTYYKADDVEQIAALRSERLDPDYMLELRMGVGNHYYCPETPQVGPAISIDTLEAQMRADVGDWIVRGVKGEIYPCKPDVFEATYEEVTKFTDARR